MKRCWLRLVLPIFVAIGLLVFIRVIGRIQEGEAELRAQIRSSGALQGRVEQLLRERKELEASWLRERALYQRLFEKVAPARELILQTAQSDALKAIGWNDAALSKCYASDELKINGWHVKCGFDVCTDPPPPLVHYVIDPLNGMILSRRIESHSDVLSTREPR